MEHLILTLATSRVDNLVVKKRKEQIKVIEQSLQLSATDRQLLVDLGDIQCSSRHAYQRIAGLYMTALLSEISDESSTSQERLNGLGKGLILLLQRSGNAKLVQSYRKFFQKEEQLTTIALEVASSTGSAAAFPLMKEEAFEWELYLKHSLTADPPATSPDIAICSPLWKQMALNDWETTVAPAIAQQLKAKPDKLLDMVEEVTKCLPRAVIVQSKVMRDELLPIFLKQLRSTKDSNRQCASSMFQNICMTAIRDTNKEQPMLEEGIVFLSAVMEVLADTKGLAQVTQRHSLYETLSTIGKALVEAKLGLDAKVVSNVLIGLVALVAKEAKTAIDVRNQGLEALMHWMVLGKRSGGSSKGWDEALSYIRKAVVAKNAADSLFLLGGMVQWLHPDIMEAIALDLFKEPKFLQGLEAMVESADKKHSSGSSIPQVEGLLATFFALQQVNSTSKELSPVFDKALTSGFLAKGKTSFLFSVVTINAVATNWMVARVLPSVLVMYVKYISKTGSSPKTKPSSSIFEAMASCVLHPVHHGPQTPNAVVCSMVRSILDYQPVSDHLVGAIFERVDTVSMEARALREAVNQNRSAREDPEKTVTIKGKGSESSCHEGVDVHAVRRVARDLAERPLSPACMAKVLILMHVGSSTRPTKKQRGVLVVQSTEVLQKMILSRGETSDSLVHAVADAVVAVAVTPNSDEQKPASGESLHSASLSLLTSLGRIASTVSEDGKKSVISSTVTALLVEEFAPRLSTATVSLMTEMKTISDLDVGVHKSPSGSLYLVVDTSEENNKKTGQGRLTEDEAWEIQMKEEMAKKKQSTGQPKTLSAEDKKTIVVQDETRRRTKWQFEKFARVLATIQALIESDIELGNACLPMLSEPILAMTVSKMPAISSILENETLIMTTLTSLASCVFEISDEFARMMAVALVIAHTGDSNSDGVTVTALPSPCEPAATTIFEMDEFQEELSGASFAFLFPVIRAALMGPRTPPGCEGAVRVLERHTILLTGEDRDSNVVKLRVDMVDTILELLKHDRAQTFVDPSPIDTLVALYQTDDDAPNPPLSTAELAPLLDERGALGNRNCRVAAMIALGSIASSHKKLVKTNPLIENRIWMNCFDQNEVINVEARKVWTDLHDANSLEASKTSDLPAPSPMYAAPLLPLLSNVNPTIAASAATAIAEGMARHPKSINRNIERLCLVYIEALPNAGSTEEDPSPSKSSLPAIPQPTRQAAPKKTLLNPAKLKKKVAKPKSVLSVAGIGGPKRTTKKRSPAVSAVFLKPKQERTLDQVALESQFKVGPQKTPAEKDSPEKIAIRSGTLQCLAALVPVDINIDISTIKLLSMFLMAYGIADVDEGAKNASRNALRDIVAKHCGSGDAIAFLLPHLDEVLKTGSVRQESLDQLPKEKIPVGPVESNRRKEGAVVALGSVALHLKGPENAAKIDTTIDMLLQSLSTPNEDVQASVADCLAKLMKKGNTADRIDSILDGLRQSCLHGDSSSSRRGGAYGLAAAVKGSGIAALKKYGVVADLEEACASGDSSSKEGSLFAIELLCTRLGLLFEPYVIVLLPSLLKCFSDSSDHVRSAASNAVGTIMSKLSAHGVKLVMPAVLTAFNDSAWRTKQASIAMLGSMCHLAPKQLAQALPKVVPKVVEAFSDTHPKVKSSAQDALDEIRTVIRNPEISSISQTLLKALTEPSGNTLSALEALIETEFLHAIDAPSLALIVPILHRGLRDRTATTKRYGALITGNMCTMINDPRDFVPYLPTLIPDLKGILLDPIPDVRSISAKAFGSLTRGLGEEVMPDLRPWLVERLRSEDVSSAERSGAAQGLTEVLIASGSALVDTFVRDDILPLQGHPSSSTREGVLWMMVYLPPALGQGFTNLLDECLPALIAGLSDDHEQVREIGMRAGRVLIKSHGRVHFKKILPILQNGMTDIDHRIRYSSLMLLGDLLSMIGGTTVLRTDGDTQDDIRRAEKAQAQLTLTLGMETRNKVLSDVYLSRSDGAVSVRQASIQVWKTVVSVTARTLRMILPTLVARVVSDLASGDIEKTEMAGKCLGDLVGKLGDSVLPEIIPVLRDTLDDEDSATRRGVCVGLSEVIGSSTRDQITKYLEIIVKVVQDALCDDDEAVRQMASSSFQNLYSLVGSRALDEVVPALMVGLESNDEIRRARSLNGLTGILSVRSTELLPYIIPRLLTVPLTADHVQALGSIAAVTGDTIHHHFKSIIPTLLNDLSSGENREDPATEESVRECLRELFASSSVAGLNRLIGTIVSKCTSDRAEMRRESCWMIETLVNERKELADFYEDVPVLIRELIHRLNDDNATVLKANFKAFAALTKSVPAEELANHLEYMRNLISSMVSDARRRKGGVGDGEFLLPGFNMPKGLEPLLPIYQRGILYGTPAIREASAAGLGEVISLTATKYLAGPLIIKMTGPLLRIVGDRNPSKVKISILKTLGLILVKGGPALRAFVPQFQTTFVKALADPSRQVRVEATAALGLLMPLSTRVDPLLKELVNGSSGKGNTDETVGVIAVQTATLDALAVVLNKGGKKAKQPESITAALATSKELICHSDESVRESAAKVMGAACNILGSEVVKGVIEEKILDNSNDDDADIRHGKACAILRILSAEIGNSVGEELVAAQTKLCLAYLKDDKESVKDAGCVALGGCIGRSKDPTQRLRSTESELINLMNNSSERMETHQAVAKGLCLALTISKVDNRVEFFGLELLKCCLKMAMSGSQRVQYAFNDVLFVALDVINGESGLGDFSAIAMFEDAKQMKSVYSKVLQKMKGITILD